MKGVRRVAGVLAKVPANAAARALVTVIATLLGLATLAGCKTDVGVEVTQLTDGTGEVVVSLLLDPEATARSGRLRSVLRTSDLESAGWSVEGPMERQPAGSSEFTLTKPFRNAGEAQLILTELTGESGPFAGLVIDRTRSPLRVVSRLEGEVDLSKGYEAFGDEAIARQFQTELLVGVTDDDLVAHYGAPLAGLLPMHLDVTMADAPTERFELLPGERVPVRVEAVRWNRIVLFPLAAAVLGLVGFLISLRRRSDDYR